MFLKALIFFSAVLFSCYDTSVAIATNYGKSCVLPPYPKHGTYNVVTESEFTSNEIKYGLHVRIDFVCAPGYTLVGKSSVKCVDGVWQEEFPHCAIENKGCDFNQLPQSSQKCTRSTDYNALCSRYVFTYQCVEAYGPYIGNCREYVPEGTTVRVSQEIEGYAGNASLVTADITCTSDGIFHITTKCVEEIVKMQYEFENISIRKRTHEYSDKFKDLAENFESFQRDIMVKINKMQSMIKECEIRLELLSAYFDNKKLTQHKTNQCNLPPSPENGRYSVFRSELSELVLQYQCNPGFALVGTPTPRCINGVWKDKFPHCSAACKLEKKAKFNYQCETEANNNACQEYVAVRSVVKVSRRQETNTAPITASIICLENGIFNITTTCVQELDHLQKYIEPPTLAKMVDFETKFIGMECKNVGLGFQRLVEDFHSFEQHVHGSYQKMNEKAEQCDIYLDLLLAD